LIGCTHTIGEIISTYNKVRGTKLQTKRLGSLEDLKKTSEERRKLGDVKGSEFYSTLCVMYDPRCKFEKNDNGCCPNVKPMSVEEFLRNHPEIKIE